MTQPYPINQSKMCEEGQILRSKAYNSATRITNDKWNSERMTPDWSRRILDDARATASAQYQEDYANWQIHYQYCETCREALRP